MADGRARVMIDFFAGLGGASEAMMSDPTWLVQRLDNNPMLAGVPNMTIADINTFLDELELAIKEGWNPSQDVELAWFSIPCDEVSLGFNSARSIADREGDETFWPTRTMGLLQVCMRIIEILEPRYWVIENTRGALKFFNPVIGEPRLSLGNKYFFWGNFPSLHIQKDLEFQSKVNVPNNEMRANIRAIIPIEISQAFKLAVESQTKLTDFN